MAKGGGNKKIFQYCTDSSGTILYLRALQGHSGRNLIDPLLQDNVAISDNFFKYIYHVGCAINSHSIINSGLLPGGQNLSKRQTLFLRCSKQMRLDKEALFDALKYENLLWGKTGCDGPTLERLWCHVKDHEIEGNFC